MAKGWPKIICDPIHDLITFENTSWDRLLLKLINTREFQRLRRIKQLGLSEMVFPGGNHSRFAHSIGVMHNARRFLDRIEKLTGKALDEMQRTAVLTAALLHDVGHGPFSHAFEKITNDHHETRTVEIITDPSTSVNEVLRNHDPKLPDLLKNFFEKDEADDGSAQELIPRFLVQVISSQLDADRFDYLVRDSYATGAGYGRFDSKWLIQHLQVDEGRGRLYLAGKAYTGAESYVFARYHMYRSVYFHKTTRAAEVMLKLLFQRYKLLIAANEQVVPEAPKAFAAAFRSNAKMPLSEYLQLDDHSVSEFMKACRSVDDPKLKELAVGILDRRLYKAVDATVAGSSRDDFVKQANELIRNKGLFTEDSLVKDTASDTPYKPYDPDGDKPNDQIYIEDSLGKQVEFSTISKPVSELKEKYSLLRYYFPEQLGDEMKEIASKTLKKD
jgi:HD superfamily phosphohydrolase